MREGINIIEVSAYHGPVYLVALRIKVVNLRSPEYGEATLTIRYDPRAKVYRYGLRSREFGETEEIEQSLIDPPPQQVEKPVTLLNAQARNLPAPHASQHPKTSPFAEAPKAPSLLSDLRNLCELCAKKTDAKPAITAPIPPPAPPEPLTANPA